MKGYIKKGMFVICMILVLFTTGCKKQVVTTCNYKNDQKASGYNINSTYNIYSDGKTVNKVVMEEVVTSKNTTVLKFFEKKLKDQYEKINSTYGGYTIDVKNKDKKVISTVTIDYNKMNLKKYVKDNVALKSYIDKNNKMTLKGAKALYESLGATCK